MLFFLTLWVLDQELQAVARCLGGSASPSKALCSEWFRNILLSVGGQLCLSK